jgi:uncharacterized tellurite resistance protein B-like protein
MSDVKKLTELVDRLIEIVASVNLLHEQEAEVLRRQRAELLAGKVEK